MTTTTTTAPDATTIEEALLRIQVVADIINTLGQALRGQHERHGNTLILMCGDLEDAANTIRPVVGHLIAERRDAA